MNENRMNSKRRFAGVLCAAAIILAAGSTATAQGRQGRGGFAGFGGGQAAPMSSADVGYYGDMLALDDEQRDVVLLLFEDFTAEYEQTMQAMRDEMQAARDGGGGFEGIREMMQGFTEKREKLQSQFLGDVRTILTPEQDANWSRVERAIRRNQGLRQGNLSGERVDVVRLVNNLEIDRSSEIASLLDEYAMTLDSAITKRNKVMESMREGRDGGNREDFQEIFAEIRAAGEKIRDINRRYARQVGSMLGTEDGAAFNEAFQRASYPQVYRPGRGARAIETVLAFEDLSSDQKSSIEAIQSEYASDTGSLNKKYVAAIDEAEASGNAFGARQGRQGRQQDDAGGQRQGGGQQGDRGQGGGGQGGFQGRGQGGPGSEIAQEKRDLDARTIERVQGVLSDTQKARLDESLQAAREGQRGQGQRGRDR